MKRTDTLREKLIESFLKSQFETAQLATPNYLYGEKYAELEALFRPFHLIATENKLKDQRFQDYLTYFNSELSSILDPKSEFFFGDIKSFDSSINEAANLAFHFSLNDAAWAALEKNNQALFLNWIKDVAFLDVKNNNWILFRGLLAAFHSEQSQTRNNERARTDFLQAASWIREDGWVQDGPNGNIDYYTGFVFYPFFLLGIKKGIFTNPEAKRILNALRRWGREIEHLSDLEGRLPLFGRSLIYRFAFLSPFRIAQNLFGLKFLPDQLTERIVSNFHYEKITTDGLLNIGVFNERPSIRENYSTRASTYWLARGLFKKSTENGTNEESFISFDDLSHRPYHKVVNCKSQSFIINANREHPESIYFQNIIDSKNGWVKLCSFGKIQILSFERFRFRWKNIVLPPNLKEASPSTISEIHFTLPRFQCIRVGWNHRIKLKRGIHVLKRKRVSDNHLRQEKFTFDERILFSFNSTILSIQLVAK